MNELLSPPIQLGELMDVVGRWYLSFGSVRCGVAEQTAHAFIAPFARVLVLALQLFKSGRQVALQTIFACANSRMLGANGHRLGFVASRKEVKAAYDYNYDQGKKQVT
jgi:hypothetical protein